VEPRERLEWLRRVQFLLDNAYRVPGLGVRFGWDAIIGLVPGIGDALTAMFALTLLVEAARMRVPKVIQLRMVFNTLVDLGIGLLPVVGDIADVFWKSNARNFVLLERHAGGTGRVRAGDWLFVGSVLAVCAAIAAAPIVVVYWMLTALSSR
jgi:hypothetical protein